MIDAVLVPSALILALLLSPSPAQQSSPDVVLLARGILAAIVANDFAKVEEQFTTEMKAAQPPGRLAATWTTLLNQAGR